ncbi:hypothetical protein GIB67_009955 [Kingdonia uniflora]|uniref:Uncharacterized protein n=1 Tax=Kingdonia uniflora TaxID=39325 RepID=A0A7J7L951_9MAGN|nr:hypothetical protein GIB67_009955 [Kingdonia uniflora]
MESSITSFITLIPTNSKQSSIPTKSLHFNTKKSLVAQSSKISRGSRIVCMAEPHLITKLDSAEKTWKELSVSL